MREAVDDLPASWSYVDLEELAAQESRAITDGPFGSNLKTSHYTESGPRVIRLENIGDGNFIDHETHISEKHFESLRRHEAQTGDIVVATLGKELPRACSVPARLGSAIVKADCVRVRPDSVLIDTHFLSNALNSRQVRQQAAAMIHGVGRPRLNLKSLRKLKIPLAPLPEQHRIVEAIEAHFSRLDAAVAALARARANLRRYRASVLKAACEGRLVPTEEELARREGREYEPAETLLERILVERRRRWEEAELEKLIDKGKKPKGAAWKKRYKEPEPPRTEELPSLPGGWCWASIEQLAAFSRNSLTDGPFGSKLKTSHYTESGPRVIRLQNIGDGEFLDTKAHISDEHYRSLERHQVDVNDIVIALLGQELPRACVVPSIGPAIVKADCIRFEPHPSLAKPSYLNAALNSAVVRSTVTDWISGVGRPRLNLSKVKRIPVPLPPRKEQSRIAAEVDRRMTLIRAVASTLEANLRRAERLRQSILKRAFEGKLVPQDPADEPASVLLERIRAERGET